MGSKPSYSQLMKVQKQVTHWHLVLQRMAAIREICQLLKEAKLEEALYGASMLVETFPDKAKLQADLGGILFRMGEYDSAVSSKFISCITCSSSR